MLEFEGSKEIFARGVKQALERSDRWQCQMFHPATATEISSSLHELQNRFSCKMYFLSGSLIVSMCHDLARVFRSRSFVERTERMETEVGG